MADISIVVDLVRGSVPDACYKVDDVVVAAIVMVDGVTSLRMTILAITVGTGDTDSVILSYDEASFPAGLELSACNLSSFQCYTDCCQEKRCFEVFGPLDEIVVGAGTHVGFLPMDTLVDQVKIFSPDSNGTEVSVVLFVNGAAVFNTTVLAGEKTIVDRANFLPAFSNGLFPEDAELTLSVITASGYTPWFGLTICLLGLHKITIAEIVTSSFDFVVQNYADLLLPGQRFYLFPHIFEMTSFGIVMHSPDTEGFGPP